jgi:hemerythrin-like metal-binding protein
MPIPLDQLPDTGHQELDGLREELVRRADQLVGAARAARTAEARAHVERVRELARALFEVEEQRLLAAGSLTLERHAREHARFLDDLAALGAELGRRGEAALAEVPVERFVREWLRAHATRTDLELRDIPSRA